MTAGGKHYSRRFNDGTGEGCSVQNTLMVLTAVDEGPDHTNASDVSLRGRILAARPGDTIRFAPALASQTIKLKSELTIAKTLAIRAPETEAAITIDAG